MSEIVRGGLLPHRRHNTLAASGSIRFWARTIGERNPRYVDPSYSSPTGGGLEAHPCWFYSVHDTCISAGHPERVPVLAGTSWTFARPVLPGEEIATRARLIDERVVDGNFAGDTPVQRVQLTYRTPARDVIAVARSTLFLIDPTQARTTNKFAGWTRGRYEPDQLARIEAASDREGAVHAQPAEPRYWDDVVPNEIVPGIVRGPLTSEELTLFVGASRPARSLEDFTADRIGGRVAAFVHPRTGVHETYEAGLIDDDSARMLGFPAAHDPGSDRVSYLGSLVTSWMGPTGDLRALDVRLVQPHMLGDTSWCYGTVRHRGAAGESTGSVTLDLTIRNQRDETTTMGSAVVELPLR